MQQDNVKVFWLDSYKGQAAKPVPYRASIHKDIETFEEKFNTEVVGIALTPDYESGRASFTIEFLTEHILSTE